MGYIIKSIRVQEPVWQRLKIRAARQGTTLTDLITLILEAAVADEMAPKKSA
jgi:macrodomain Ter protein organizer (MatP/YcbG family)